MQNYQKSWPVLPATRLNSEIAEFKPISVF